MGGVGVVVNKQKLFDMYIEELLCTNYGDKKKSSPMTAMRKQQKMNKREEHLQLMLPIVQELQRAMGRDTTLDSDTRRDTGISDNFNIISENEQFAKIRRISITQSGTSPLRIIFETDLHTNRGYISDVLSSTENLRTELIGSFVTRVNDELVFTKLVIAK